MAPRGNTLNSIGSQLTGGQQFPRAGGAPALRFHSTPVNYKSGNLINDGWRVARARARPTKLGAPPSGWEGGSWVSPSASSFRDDIDTDKPWLPHYVESPTAPWPILRVFHQSTRQGIAVHILELLSFLPVCVYIEIVKPRLPERSDVLHRFRKGKSKLSYRAFPVSLP